MHYIFFALGRNVRSNEMTPTARPRRARRSQLSVPGSNEKMLTKGAASAADCVFCDLEDAVAPTAKLAARQKVIWALNTLDWGQKTRSVRINDVTTEWCHGDIIEVVEGAGANLDTIILTKPYSAADVIFLDRMLTQLEKKLRLQRRIGIEVLIEEVHALQDVENIARATDRVEALIFGMGDYSASQGIDNRALSQTDIYPGDIFHHARFRIVMAARAAGIDAVDGPYPNFRNESGFREEARRAHALGMVGKWAIHPSQIAPALEVFSPKPEEVARARKIEAAYDAALSQGVGAVEVDGEMIDVALIRLARNTIERAQLYGL
jgi:citrate lyase subunit beta/citryl-CoA lyase